MLTDVPIGMWTSATALDVVGGPDGNSAARRLTAIGIAAALPTAASGLLDWAYTEPADAEVRRVGVVHAASNVTALAFYAASLAVQGRRGRLLRLVGAGAMAVGGHLGGHLSYSEAVGVDATALGSTLDEWTDAGSAAGLLEGEPVCRRAGAVDVLLGRNGERICALADRCSHRGGALHDGTVEDGSVTCPLHGSRFRLADGAWSAVRPPIRSPRSRSARRRAGSSCAPPTASRRCNPPSPATNRLPSRHSDRTQRPARPIGRRCHVSAPTPSSAPSPSSKKSQTSTTLPQDLGGTATGRLPRARPPPKGRAERPQAAGDDRELAVRHRERKVHVPAAAIAELLLAGRPQAQPGIGSARQPDAVVLRGQEREPERLLVEARERPMVAALERELAQPAGAYEPVPIADAGERSLCLPYRASTPAARPAMDRASSSSRP